MHHLWFSSSLSWPLPNVFLSRWWPISIDNRNLSNAYVGRWCVCVGHWLMWRVFMQSSVSCQFSDISHSLCLLLSALFHSCLSSTDTCLSLRLTAVHLWVQICAVSRPMCLTFYLCVFSCVHILPVERALSRTPIDRGLDRRGKRWEAALIRQ